MKKEGRPGTAQTSPSILAVYPKEDQDPPCVLRGSWVKREDPTVREALEVMLDQVDYLVKNCSPNQPVGAVLDPIVIKNARSALANHEETNKR